MHRDATGRTNRSAFSDEFPAPHTSRNRFANLPGMQSLRKSLRGKGNGKIRSINRSYRANLAVVTC